MFLRAVISISYNHGQKSWDNLHYGVFSNTHRPNPSPQPTKKSWTRVSGTDLEFFFPVSTLYRVGVGRNGTIFRKGCIFYEGTQNREKNMNTACFTVPMTFVHDCALLSIQVQ